MWAWKWLIKQEVLFPLFILCGFRIVVDFLNQSVQSYHWISLSTRQNFISDILNQIYHAFSVGIMSFLSSQLPEIFWSCQLLSWSSNLKLWIASFSYLQHIVSLFITQAFNIPFMNCSTNNRKQVLEGLG